jgi:hypothetical protein
MGSEIGKRMRDTLRVIDDFNRKLEEIEKPAEGSAGTREAIAAPNPTILHEESASEAPH